MDYDIFYRVIIHFYDLEPGFSQTLKINIQNLNVAIDYLNFKRARVWGWCDVGGGGQL